ncbi:MAG: patatin-like phospholipase family protein [Acidimicrobiia bacterium]|nr:patatin-like phospholipase family protein [Acidimicrobiia bacterium]
MATFPLEWLQPPFSGGHWVPDLVERAGGAPLLCTPGEHSRPLRWTDVAAAAPEVVVFMPCGYDLAAAVAEAAALADVAELRTTPAWRDHRVWAVDATAYFSRPGPRIVDGLELLAWIIHPDAFPPPPHGRLAPLLPAPSGRLAPPPLSSSAARPHPHFQAPERLLQSDKPDGTTTARGPETMTADPSGTRPPSPPCPHRPSPRQRVGLVLGAGGPVGHAFHAGVLAALADAGWDARGAEVIVGTSIGAVTGALLRADLSPADLYARATGRPMSAAGAARAGPDAPWALLGCDLERDVTPLGRPASLGLLAHLARHPSHTRAGLLLAAVTPSGTLSTAPTAGAINAMVGRRWPDRTLWACSVCLDDGHRVILGPDRRPAVDMGTAVAASIAVPAVFAPVVVGGRRLVDGGLHSPANADVMADALGRIDAVVVSAPMGIGSPPGRLGVDLPGRALNHWTTHKELRRLRAAGLPVTVFEPGPSELEFMHYDAFDLTHRQEIARRAYEHVSRTAAIQTAVSIPAR